jgi:hypothetical protein
MTGQESPRFGDQGYGMYPKVCFGWSNGDSCTLVANDLCKVVVVSSILIVSTLCKLSFSANSVTDARRAFNPQVRFDSCMLNPRIVGTV